MWRYLSATVYLGTEDEEARHYYEERIINKFQDVGKEDVIELRISNGTNYLAHGRSEAKMQDQRSLREFRSLRTVFRSIALRSARPSGALLERARSV